VLNWGVFCLTQSVKMGYNKFMFAKTLLIVLRIWLIAAVWILIWRFVEPKTQTMRVLRAALLLVCLLVILAAVRITGQ